jgi:hypothetical protein
MKLYDLDKLIRDNNQNKLYNFFDPTFKLLININLATFVVGREQVMRPDLISKEIYGSVNYVDFILDINDIDNPLNIMEDDQILYPPIGTEPDYRVRTIDNNDVRAKLLNVNKSSRKDDSRKKYVEDNYSLPPTYLKEPEASVKIVNGQIVIGG